MINRRNLIKTIMVAPLMGAVTTTKAAKTKQAAREPDWDRIITNQGFEPFTKSICRELMLIINGPGIRASHPVLVETVYAYPQEMSFPNQYARFIIDDYMGFDISRNEFQQNNHEQLIRLVKCRWIDFLWSMDSEINMRIGFIQRFDPDYNPKEHQG